MKKVHFSVTGLQNEQMKNDIKNALEKVDGVQSINIDLGRSTIEVGYNEASDENTIKEKIQHAGCNIR